MTLRIRLILTFCLVAAVPVAVLATWLWVDTRASLLARAEDQVAAMATIQGARLAAEMLRIGDASRLVQSRTQMRQSLSEYLADGNPEHLARIRRILEDAKRSTAHLTSIHLHAPDGRLVVATAGDEATTLDAALLPTAHDDLHVAGFERDGSGVRVVVIGPLLLDDRPIGRLVARFDDAGLRAIASDFTGLGRSGQTVLFHESNQDRRGRVALTAIRFDEGAALTRQLDRASAPMIGSARPGAFHAPRGSTSDTPVITAGSIVGGAVDGGQVGVIVEIERAEVLEPLAAFGGRTVLVALLLIALAGLAGTRLSRPFSNLARAVREIILAEPSDDLATVRDEARVLAAALRLAFLRSRRAVKQQEELLATCAHDLKGPLGSIRMLTDMALDGTYESAEAPALFARLNKQAHYGLSLIMRLLERAKLEGGAELSFERFDLVELANACGEVFAPLARERKVTVNLVGPEQLSFVADQLCITQLLNNVLGNAVELTREGGQVEVLIEARQADGSAAVRIDVKDQGPGIDPETLPAIFEPFQRQRFTRRRGSGLGLSISKRICTAHGGSIAVASTGPEGTVFRIDLPSNDTRLAAQELQDSRLQAFTERTRPEGDDTEAPATKPKAKVAAGG